ncbi:MAG: hypothetical protein KKD77_23600 [Gammaproteobacteria bacterium]|nr:hypothetical protein [Gammaproteobacteria bacterium]
MSNKFKKEQSDTKNPYWRTQAELDDRFDMDEAIKIRREERELLLQIEREDYESINNY